MNEPGCKLTPYEKMRFKQMSARKKTSCFGCNKICSKECGAMEYELVSSSAGRWVKRPDDRCVEGL